MKAMILAAGRGNRLRPITDSIPKPLVRVGDRSLIEHHLCNLAAAGVREVVINLGYRGGQIRTALGDGSAQGIRIAYSDEGDPPLETGGGLKAALPLLGAEPFLLVNSDIYTDFGYARLVANTLAVNDLAHLVLVPNPPENPAGDFVFDAGRARAEGAPRCTYAGIAVIRPELVAAVSESRFPLAPLLRNAMDADRVGAELHIGLWNDVGTPDRLAQLNHRLGPG